jgi:hypothetical protein
MRCFVLLRERAWSGGPSHRETKSFRQEEEEEEEEEATRQRAARLGCKGVRVEDVFTTVLISAEHPGAILSMKTWPDG